LTPEQIALGELRFAAATLGDLEVELVLTGEVALDEDRLAHIVPWVPGVAQEVLASLGDDVRAGDVLAVIASRELADAKAEYLAARERLSLTRTSLEREEGLWERRLSSEQEYLEAKREVAEASIAVRSAAQKLEALEPDVALERLSARARGSLTRYEVRAPFDGTIIEKHVARGELVGNDELYTLCDLGKVWIIASVYEKDLARVALGQEATLRAKAYPTEDFRGAVTWIAGVLDEATRTLKIRIEADNSRRLLKPGMFVEVALTLEHRRDVLTVPVPAIQRHDGETVVFVEAAPGRFERREVRPGVRSGAAVEILDGLAAGESVVVSGSFLLISELDKEGFEAGHGH
jgi:cobalt-zinc-cadmium efflux system membrane fusion protein